MTSYRFLTLIVGLVFLAGCGGAPAQEAGGSPTRDWPESTPAEQGMDGALLEQMLAHIDETNLNLHSLLVIRHGTIVLEKYFPGHGRSEQHAQYSVTKSFTATLFGIAMDQGKLQEVNLPVKDFFREKTFANPDPRKDKLVLEDLLTMASGLDWLEGDLTYSAMYRSGDWVGYVMDLALESDPGERFTYCSGCSHVLLQVVQQAVGMDVVDYARENLFAPLGIRDFQWERTPQGEAIGGWGLNLTARDMAKLGYLYLHGGVWEGKQVVSKSWIETATTKHLETGGRLGYGYQWWTYPTHNAYAALGRGGQTIFVIPDLDVIVVTTADLSDGHDPIFQLIDNFIIPGVTAQ